MPNPVTRQEEIELEQVYSRGLGSFFVSGTNHQEVVSGRSPRHRGVLAGRVTQVYKDRVTVEPTGIQDVAPLKPGDGIVFDAADWRSPEIAEEGGHIYEIKPAGKLIELYFANRAIDFSRIRPGDWVWRNHDVNIDKAGKPFTQANTPLYKQVVNAQVVAHEGQLLQLTWTLPKHPEISVTVQSDEPLTRANSRSLTAEYLHQQLGRLGNTAYRLEELTLDIEGEPFIPSSLLNRLRQEAVEQLVRQQTFKDQLPTQHPLRTLDNALADVIARPKRQPLASI